MKNSQQNPPHVVVVGGGFGGLYAVRELAGLPVRVTLLDRHNHHLFQPLLYQVATAALSPGDIASPIRSILRGYKNVAVELAEVVSIDIARRSVILADAEVSYDYLILATGVTHSYFGHEEWAAAAPGLKSIEDALEIRRRILTAFERAERAQDTVEQRALLTFVIVGGGPTGVELAGAIAEISRYALKRDFRRIEPERAQIVLLELAPRILSNFPEKLSATAERHLKALGVEVRTGAKVTRVDAAGVSLGNERISSKTVLWAAGIRASDISASLGVPLDAAKRVLVEPDLSIPGHREVFIIGDLAAFTHQTGKPLPGVAPVAMQQGRWTAANIGRDLRSEPRRPFHYHDRGSMATIGRAAGICWRGRLQFGGFLGWLAWLFVHIYFLIGFRNRLLVMIQWAWAYVSYQRGARLITGR